MLKKWPHIMAWMLWFILSWLIFQPGMRNEATIYPLLIVTAVIQTVFCWRYYRSKEVQNADVVCIIHTLLIVWEIVTRQTNLLNMVLYPSPEAVFAVFVADWQEMLKNIKSSLELLFVGFFVSFSAAIGAGLITGSFLRLRNSILPIIRVIAPVPSVIYTPYIVALMPTFRSASAMVLILGLLFPLYMNIVLRIEGIDKKLTELADVLQLSRWRRLRHFYFPYIMPGVIRGSRISLSAAFMILTLAEMMGATSGLGYYIKNYADFGNYTKVMAGIITVAVVVTLLNRFIGMLEKRFIKW